MRDKDIKEIILEVLQGILNQVEYEQITNKDGWTHDDHSKVKKLSLEYKIKKYIKSYYDIED